MIQRNKDYDDGRREKYSRQKEKVQMTTTLPAFTLDSKTEYTELSAVVKEWVMSS